MMDGILSFFFPHTGGDDEFIDSLIESTLHVLHTHDH